MLSTAGVNIILSAGLRHTISTNEEFRKLTDCGALLAPFVLFESSTAASYTLDPSSTLNHHKLGQKTWGYKLWSKFIARGEKPMYCTDYLLDKDIRLDAETAKSARTLVTSICTEYSLRPGSDVDVNVP